MTKGPAKVSVRIDGDDSKAAAEEAFQVYYWLVKQVEVFNADEEK
jgi:hypothetical protein